MSWLRRAVAQSACSQHSIKCVVLRPRIAALFARSYFTKKPRKAKLAAADVWPRPREIPFQAKVVNSVSLIGHVDSPVQFETSPDGKHLAGTVITQRVTSHSHQFWIPVVFEGDLAHIGACHLKKDDHVHIAGQLSAVPPSPLANQYANVQVMVHSVNFVEVSYKKGKSFSSRQQEVGTADHSGLSPWYGLLDNPELWWDYRSQKLSGLFYPWAITLNKESGWVLPQLDGMEFDVKTPNRKNMKQGNESWKDLTENPKNWWDNRLKKMSKYSPDFKHKESGEGL